MAGGLSGMLLLAKSRAKGDGEESDDYGPGSEESEASSSVEDDALDEAFHCVKDGDPAGFRRSMKLFAQECYARHESEKKG